MASPSSSPWLVRSAAAVSDKIWEVDCLAWRYRCYNADPSSLSRGSAAIRYRPPRTDRRAPRGDDRAVWRHGEGDAADQHSVRFPILHVRPFCPRCHPRRSIVQPGPRHMFAPVPIATVAATSQRAGFRIRSGGPDPRWLDLRCLQLRPMRLWGVAPGGIAGSGSGARSPARTRCRPILHATAGALRPGRGPSASVACSGADTGLGSQRQLLCRDAACRRLARVAPLLSRRHSSYSIRRRRPGRQRLAAPAAPCPGRRGTSPAWSIEGQVRWREQSACRLAGLRVAYMLRQVGRRAGREPLRRHEDLYRAAHADRLDQSA